MAQEQDNNPAPDSEDLQSRNRRSGIILAAIIVGIFCLTLGIALFVHYMGLHHHVIGGF